MNIVRNPIDAIWAPVDYVTAATSVTLYMGQLITTTSATGGIVTSGATNMTTGAGKDDVTNLRVPFGVVAGTNNFTKAYDSASLLETITSANTPALQRARDFRSVEGYYPKNDPRAFVRIALIGPQTVLWAPLFQGAWGTAPTVYTASAVNATAGLGFTTSVALANAGIAYNQTWFCRSGLNQGLSRVSYDTSTTAHTFYVYWPYTLAIGDTFVYTPLKEFGSCFMNIDALGLYIDNTAYGYGTNCFGIEVLKLDLRIAGQEGVYFKFNFDHFCASR